MTLFFISSLLGFRFTLVIVLVIWLLIYLRLLIITLSKFLDSIYIVYHLWDKCALANLVCFLHSCVLTTFKFCFYYPPLPELVTLYSRFSEFTLYAMQLLLLIILCFKILRLHKFFLLYLFCISICLSIRVNWTFLSVNVFSIVVLLYIHIALLVLWHLFAGNRFICSSSTNMWITRLFIGYKNNLHFIFV